MVEVTERTARSIAAEALDALKREFIDEALDDTRGLDQALAGASGDPAALSDVLARAHRLARWLKGGAGSHGLSLLGVAAHRLDDYLGAVEQPYERHLHDLQIFLDCLTELLEHGGVGGESAAHLVRRLPPRRGFDVGDVTVCEIEVLLVMQPGVARRMIEREVQACGYRVTAVGSAFEALELIVRTQPDLAIFTGVLQDLSGIDLAVGLRAMPQTRNTGLALITSFEREHESLGHLPPTVPIIRKGPTFADDLTAALSDQFII